MECEARGERLAYMTVDASRLSSPAFARWQQDVVAGLIVGVLALPICLAAGVLAFSPLGPNFVAQGAAAGLYGAIAAGAVTALVATSSFVITCPRATPSLVLASLIAALLVNPAFTGKPALIITAAALCVFLAGLWQILFGLLRIASIIKFTPYPVFAGFVNGIALLIVVAQIKPFFVINGDSALPAPQHLLMLAFVVGLAILAIFYVRIAKKLALPPWTAKVPGTIVAFTLGIVAYHLANWLLPDFDLGPVIGKPSFAMTLPLLHVLEPDTTAHIWTIGWNLLLVSLVLAVIASMETLMSLRLAVNIAELEVHPMRELAAQGCGNCAAAMFTAIASAATPTLLLAAFRAGGRTRLTGIAASSTILIFGVMFSDAIAIVPKAVLSAVLISVAVMMFDTWSIGLLTYVVRRSSPLGWQRAFYDLVIVAVVMGITVMTTIAIGVIGGCLLSVLIFAVNMSRPVVRHSYWGHEIYSKRIRSAEDMALLKKMGHRRAVLQLEGALFFGNAEDLSIKVKQLFVHADMIVLDMRAITDIDVSGSNILRNIVSRSREQGKRLLFCNIPAAQTTIVRNLFDQQESADAALKIDLESALEWMEEESLRANLDQRSLSGVLALEQIDFFAGVSTEELEKIRQILKFCEFKSGETICQEGDPGDKMWLLAKGSVSVRLYVTDSRGSRRITSLGRGTIFGEMALIEGAPRSATIVADEDVVCYQLSGDDFNILLRDQPDIAAKIMRNTARELARRLRQTSEDLRHATS